MTRGPVGRSLAATADGNGGASGNDEVGVADVALVKAEAAAVDVAFQGTENCVVFCVEYPCCCC